MLKADDITVSLQLANTGESLGDIQRVLSSLDNLHASSLLSLAISDRVEDREVAILRQRLESSLDLEKAARRFFPGLGPERFPDPGSKLALVARFFEEMDPEDPLDVGVAFGLKRWVVEIAQTMERDLGSAQFPVQQVGRQSPVLIAISIGLSTPMLLTFGLLYAVGRFRRYNAETEIRLNQARALASIARQQEQRESFQADVFQALRARILAGEVQVPEEVVATAAQVASLDVGDLSDKSLVGTLNLGLNLKS